MLDASQFRFGRCTVVVFILVALCRTGVATRCPGNFHVIPLQDARDAAYASEYVYKKTAVKDVRIPNTKYYVRDIVEEPLLTGETVKVLVADEGNNRIIAFRGTTSPEQLGQQLAMAVTNLISKTHVVVYNSKDKKHEEVMVLGFNIGAYRKLQPDLARYMNDTKFRYIITGHSLGGAIASLFSLMTKQNDRNTWRKSGTCLITFGAPRVGGKRYAELHDQEISPKRKIRFVNKLDVVPHVPKTFTSVLQTFKHHSREVWFATLSMMGKSGKKCKRIGLWVYKKRVCVPRRDNTAAWKVCKEGDKRDCSNKKILFSVRDHAIRNYIRQLRNVPGIIYDKRNQKYTGGTRNTRWGKAMRCSN